VTRQEIVHAAREYVGVPFQHQGRTKNGIDCGGLLICTAWDLGTLSRDWDGKPYPKQPTPQYVKWVFDTFWVKCSDLELKPGRVALMGLPVGPAIHIGLITSVNGRPYLLHASPDAGRVAEHRIDSVWRKRITAVYEYPGVED
jgi:hypothetical protein